MYWYKIVAAIKTMINQSLLPFRSSHTNPGFALVFAQIHIHSSIDLYSCCIRLDVRELLQSFLRIYCENSWWNTLGQNINIRCSNYRAVRNKIWKQTDLNISISYYCKFHNLLWLHYLVLNTCTNITYRNQWSK